MKISVCGKGGSGKSVVVALMADALRQRGKEVIVLDSDESNANLFWMLGLDRPPRPLMDLLGGRKGVKQKMRKKSIWEMEKIPIHEIPEEYVAKGDGIRLVATGKIHQSLEGCACPMGAVTREFLKKLELTPNEIALVDMEAGIEHFGRGIEASVDRVVCVVEPSLESISMAKRVMELTKAAGATFNGAILNKISNPEQKNIVIGKLGEVDFPVIGTIGYHEEIRSACLKGGRLTAQIVAGELKTIIDSLLGGSNLSQ